MILACLGKNLSASVILAGLLVILASTVHVQNSLLVTYGLRSVARYVQIVGYTTVIVADH